MQSTSCVCVRVHLRRYQLLFTCFASLIVFVKVIFWRLEKGCYLLFSFFFFLLFCEMRPFRSEWASCMEGKAWLLCDKCTERFVRCFFQMRLLNSSILLVEYEMLVLRCAIRYSKLNFIVFPFFPQSVIKFQLHLIIFVVDDVVVVVHRKRAMQSQCIKMGHRISFAYASSSQEKKIILT